jgi:hypothetical protein
MILMTRVGWDELRKVFACWVEVDRENCNLIRQGLLRFRRPHAYRVNEKPTVGQLSRRLVAGGRGD